MPAGLVDSESGCDTVALLDLSLLEAAIDASDRAVGRGPDDFEPAEVAAAAIDFDGVALLEPVVGADGDFDELRAGGLADAAHEAVDRRDDGVGRGVLVEAAGVDDGGVVGVLAGELTIALDGVVQLT